MIGIHEAHQAALPVVLFVGQLESRIRGRRALQEMEFSDVFRSAAKAVFEVTMPDQAATAVLAALRLAQLDPPGPVVVSVPADHFYGDVAAVDARALRLGPAAAGMLAPSASTNSMRCCTRRRAA